MKYNNPLQSSNTESDIHQTFFAGESSRYMCFKWLSHLNMSPEVRRERTVSQTSSNTSHRADNLTLLAFWKERVDLWSHSTSAFSMSSHELYCSTAISPERPLCSLPGEELNRLQSFGGFAFMYFDCKAGYRQLFFFLFNQLLYSDRGDASLVRIH